MSNFKKLMGIAVLGAAAAGVALYFKKSQEDKLACEGNDDFEEDYFSVFEEEETAPAKEPAAKVKEAVEKAVSSAAQSVLVSGLGFFAATYGVGLYSNVDIISSMCRLIARGALLSVAVVLLLLPAMLLLLDKIIVHSTLDMKAAR